MLELKIFEAYISKNEILQRTLYYFTYNFEIRKSIFQTQDKKLE